MKLTYSTVQYSTVHVQYTTVQYSTVQDPQSPTAMKLTSSSPSRTIRRVPLVILAGLGARVLAVVSPCVSARRIMGNNNKSMVSHQPVSTPDYEWPHRVL